MKELLKTIPKIVQFEGFQAIIDQKKLALPTQAILVEAHPDDSALAEAIDIKLARAGVGLTIVTFTDGSARSINGFNSQTLARRRREESIRSAEKSEAAMVINFGYPDGELALYERSAAESFTSVLDTIKPTLLIVPHESDPHDDHASASNVAKKAADELIPLYSMDTIDMHDKFGRPIRPTHYFYVSEEEKMVRDEAYLLHTTQVTNLPPHEMQDVKNVLKLPQKRGAKIGLKNAGILVKGINGKLEDPAGDILGKALFVT